MNRDLHDQRKSYEKGELTEDSVSVNPLEQFTAWFNEATESNEVDETNAMTLATTGADGFPRGRVVLLKEYNQDGFVFYTNYGSEKGQAIAHNNHVCISFFWPALERQIIIKGIATKISEEQSNTYFKARPRKSQLGALVSDQSNEIESREVLQQQMNDLVAQYEGEDVPKPINWGGYNIKPIEYEFWQGRRSRLHDRIQYSFNDNKWTLRRLQP